MKANKASAADPKKPGGWLAMLDLQYGQADELHLAPWSENCPGL